MLERIEIFRLAQAMAIHAGARQAVVAQNIANADTPGYKARDVVPFAEMVKHGGNVYLQRATRPGHLHGTAPDAAVQISDAEDGTANPNDNGVSLEDEMLKAVEVKRQHDQALAIYRSGLNILRATLGRG